MEQAAEVTVSEARRRELTPGSGVEQGEIGRVVETQGAETAAVLEDGARDGVEELGAGSGEGDRPVGLQLLVHETLGQFDVAVVLEAHAGSTAVSTQIKPRSIGWSASIRFAIFSLSDSLDSRYWTGRRANDSVL
jgi:hypothetical protein